MVLARLVVVSTEGRAFRPKKQSSSRVYRAKDRLAELMTVDDVELARLDYLTRTNLFYAELAALARRVDIGQNAV